VGRKRVPEIMLQQVGSTLEQAALEDNS